MKADRALVIAWKELLQLRRDRLTLAMMAVLPVVLLLLFGYAINTDVRHIPTLVYDHDRSAESRDLVRRLEATGFYDVVGDVDGLRRDRARAALRTARAPPSSCRRATRADLAAGRAAQRAARRRRLGSPDRRRSAHEHGRVARRGALCGRAARRALTRVGGRARPEAARPGPRRSLQPRPAHGRLHRAGAHRRHPHDDHGHAHRDGHRARARARHARAAHRLAGPPRRARRRQDPAVRRHRLRADGAHPRVRGRIVFGVPDPRLAPAALRARVPVHRREPRHRPLLLDAREDAAAGDADVASSSCCRTSCSAGSCSRSRPCRGRRSALAGAAADPLPAHRARHRPQGQRVRRPRGSSSCGSRPSSWRS